MGRRMRAYDWASHPLGRPEAWPQALKIAIRLILNTGHPMYVWWGPELYCFYNDAYSRSIGPERHPGSLGQHGRDVWAEIWPIIGAQIEQVMSGGGATWQENALVPITRHGRREDVYWTYSYSPIDDQTAANGVGGVLVVCSETTRAMLTERQRSAEMARLKEIFAQSPSFVAVLRGPEHVFEITNEAYQRLIGPRDVIGKPVREGLPEIAGQGLYELLDRVYTTGERHVGYGQRVMLARRPGEPHSEAFVDFIYQPMRDETGAITGIFVEGYDVTETHLANQARFRSEAALRESERELRRLTDNLPVLISFIDASERYRFVNGTYEAWFGHSREEIEGAHMRDVVGEKAYSLLKPHVERALRGERTTLESTIPYRDGGSRDVHVEYLPRTGENGNVTGFYVLVQDIGERKHAEAALRESEARYRTLFENVAAGFCIVEMIFDDSNQPVDYRFIETNPAFEAQTGLVAAQGRRARDLVPDLEQKWVDAYGSVALTGQPVRFENHSEPMGRWFDVHAFRVGQPEERRVAILFNDITGRGRAEAALRENEARLRFLDDITREASVTQDPDRILAVKTRMLGEHLGVDLCAYADVEPDEDTFTIRGDWSAPGVESIVGAYSLDDFGAFAAGKLRAGEPLVVDDSAALGEDGSQLLRFGLRSVVCIPLMKQGRFAALMAVRSISPRRWTPGEIALVREITGRAWAHIERARAQTALAKRATELQAVFDAAPAAIWIARDSEAKQIDGNAFARRLLRLDNGRNMSLSADEEAPSGFRVLDAGGSEVRPEDLPVQRAARGEPVRDFEEQVVFADGARIDLVGNAQPLFDESGSPRGAVASFVDITARKQAERQLHELNETLEQRIDAALAERAHAEEALRQAQKLEALGQLTGGIAHDFNNLLMIVQAGLNMLERRDDKAHRDMLVTRMREAVTRGANLTRQLLAFSRKQELAPEAVDFADQITGMADLLDRSLGPQVEVELDLAYDLAPIYVDPNALQLSILNLAVNARDAMPMGGPIVIRAANGAPNDPKAACVSISVTDTGTGMTPEVQARIFEPFFTTKEIGKGSGLGLAQVHGFAQQSGGRVEVETARGKGTTITLVLPQSEKAAYPVLKPSASFRAARETGEAGHVLLVEDDDEVAALTMEMLEHLGWRVTRAASAQAALGALANGRDVDLVLSDVMMPGGMSGLELAQEARRRRPRLPIVLTSGYAEAVRRDAEQAGVPLLPKPFNLDTLAAVLEVARLN